MSVGPVPITAAQLLIVEPNAYVNLCLMFDPGPDPANPVPLELDRRKQQLFMVTSRDVVLLSKDPPGILRFDAQTCKWVQVAPEKG